jgi:hypothetical protein
MCRSSAERRLQIERLGAQTQTVLLACRELCVACEKRGWEGVSLGLVLAPPPLAHGNTGAPCLSRFPRV